MHEKKFTKQDMENSFWGGVRYGQDGLLKQLMKKETTPIDFPEWIEKYENENIQKNESREVNS